MLKNPKKSAFRVYSRYGRTAVVLLGQQIRVARIDRKLTIKELAERVGVSLDMMRRIEKGDPRCGIGLVFESAVVVGIPLFDADRNTLASYEERYHEKLKLLPKAIHKPRTVLKDDF